LRPGAVKSVKVTKKGNKRRAWNVKQASKDGNKRNKVSCNGGAHTETIAKRGWAKVPDTIRGGEEHSRKKEEGGQCAVSADDFSLPRKRWRRKDR